MISSHTTYQVGLERIDDLRRETEAWRSMNLARAELNPSPSRPPEQPLHPTPTTTNPLTRSPGERQTRPNRPTEMAQMTSPPTSTSLLATLNSTQADDRLESSSRIARSASGATQPTATAEDGSAEAAHHGRVSAREWFASGARQPYDPIAKTILETGSDEGSAQPLHVFEKAIAAPFVGADTRWLTMLPGYPDGSYGYAQVDRYLGPEPAPRLYVEYLGQGDSDKPKRYRYSSIERADLIEAQWRAHGIRRTMAVTFDYSSVALLELLRRQQERQLAGEEPGTRIDAVFIINGGLFADCHSHPWDTTPMLKTPVGRVAMWFAQHAPGVMHTTLRNAKLFSPSYQVSAGELADLSEAIRRRGGAAFMHHAAGFVAEHRRNPARWDLAAIARELQGKVAFHIAGSEQDPFEPGQITAARERLAPFDVDIRTLPGGHLTTSEHPQLLADAIRELADTHRVGQPIRHAAPTTGETTP